MSYKADKPLVSPEVLERLPSEAVEIVLMLLERIDELERRLGLTPQNSSLPPSSQHPHAKPTPPKSKTGKKRGGQKGHEKHERTLLPPERVDETIVLKPKSCRRCGKRLQGDDPQPLRHQVFELPEIEPIVTEYRRHRLRCPCCKISTCAELPRGVPEHQSGPRLVAFSALLMACFRQSKRRTALFLETLCHIPCSSSLTVKLQNTATLALRPCYERMREALPRCDAVGMDETPVREANRKAWLWTAVTKWFTLFRIADSREASVAKELLGEKYSGVVTSDRYAGYDWIDNQQLCWAHLLRDFQSLIDFGGKAKPIGRRLKACGQKLFHHWHRYRDGTVTRNTMRRNIRKLWWPVFEDLEKGTLTLHGKQAGMCQHILDRVDFLWTFLEHENVEPTNNASERSLRHAVIWRKLSFGTQSESGSRFVETMLSMIETCRQQNRNVIDFVSESVQAYFNGNPTPKLLIDA